MFVCADDDETERKVCQSTYMYVRCKKKKKLLYAWTLTFLVCSVKSFNWFLSSYFVRKFLSKSWLFFEISVMLSKSVSLLEFPCLLVCLVKQNFDEKWNLKSSIKLKINSTIFLEWQGGVAKRRRRRWERKRERNKIFTALYNVFVYWLLLNERCLRWPSARWRFWLITLTTNTHWKLVSLYIFFSPSSSSSSSSKLFYFSASLYSVARVRKSKFRIKIKTLWTICKQFQFELSKEKKTNKKRAKEVKKKFTNCTNKIAESLSFIVLLLPTKSAHTFKCCINIAV